MHFVLLAFLICVLSSVIFFACRWRKAVFGAFEGTNIPGPPPKSWIWGSLYDYWTPTSVDSVSRWMKEYGDTFGFYLGDQPIVVTKNVDLLKNILIKDFNNFAVRGATLFMFEAHSSFKDTLLFSDAIKWKMTRTTMTQAMSTTKIKAMMPALSHSADLFMETLRESADKKEDLEVSETLADLTFDIIGKGAFGITTDAQRSRMHPIFALALRTHHVIMHGTAYDLFQSFSRLSWLLTPLVHLHDWIFGNPFTALSNQIKPVIKMRKENPSLQRPDMLQNLIEAEISNVKENDNEQDSTKKATVAKVGHMTEDEVSVNSIFVFLGGYDTTRLTLSYWMFYMAKFPRVQERMRKEVQDALVGQEELNHEVVTGLQYCKQVMNEVLRISPPVPAFTTRRAAQDYHYKDIVIKKGMNVMAATYEIHHDPHYWTDPDVFDPDRFCPERNVPQVAFQPFGAGPRQCFGMRLALLETIYVAARVLLQFTIHFADRQKSELEYHSYAMLLGPKDGIWIKFQHLDTKDHS